jgi:hypothetical protein
MSAAGDSVVLISCFGDHDTGGGLFIWDGELKQVDHLSTTGLAGNGERLFRLLRSSAEADVPGELIVYDRVGARAYHRLDHVRDAHDAVWTDQGLAIACPGDNQVGWLDEAAHVARRWRAGGDGDAWHLNGLTVLEGRVVVSAFGRFAGHREWNHPRAQGAGIVFDLETGEDLVSGLSCPHSPRWADGRWYVCDSLTAQLSKSPTGGMRRVGEWRFRAGREGSRSAKTGSTSERAPGAIHRLRRNWRASQSSTAPASRSSIAWRCLHRRSTTASWSIAGWLAPPRSDFAPIRAGWVNSTSSICSAKQV